MLTRVLVVAAGLMVLSADLTAVAFHAHADPIANVDCSQDDPRPGCNVGAGNTGGSGGPRMRPVSGGHGGGGPRVCRDWNGKVAPCTDPVHGPMGADGCYWRVATGYQPPAGVQPPSGQRGARYAFYCGDDANGAQGVRWLAAPPAGAAAPDPEELAVQARNRLDLPEPVIRSSPDVEQLVQLPTWMWVAPDSWAPRTATAGVPGVAVTATARPTKVTWRMGDHWTVVCRGPGTPWKAGIDPSAASPTCGHTYRRSSAGQPGDAYPVSATVSWSVSWAGAGQSGTFPDLVTTSSAAFRVDESQALVTSTR
jgi:hypothetical protein